MRALRKTMDYFGLSEPQHEDLETYQDEYLEEAPAAPSAKLDAAPVSDFKAASSKPALDNVSDFTEISRPTLAAVEPKKTASSTHKEMARIITIHPSCFEDAPEIGKALRDNVPVIVNLSDMHQAEQRRMVDFCAGVIFAINGKIDRISHMVFLLSPASVEVVEEEGYKAEPARRRHY